MNRQRLPVLIALVVIVILIGSFIYVLTQSVADAESREYHITIPAGTGALIARGEDPDVIPARIELVLEEKDILVIENQDIEGHRIGDFWVGAGETLRQKFHSEATYQGECTIHKSAQIQIVVTRKD